jgi:hypothetical protein
MDVKQVDGRKRQLLKRSAYALLLGTAVPLPVLSQLVTHDGAKRFPDPVPSLDSMRAIGREYLNKYPDEHSRSTLLSLLRRGTGPESDGPYGFSWGELRRAIQDDFETEDVVFLNDWCLSRTEGRLCALAVV